MILKIGTTGSILGLIATYDVFEYIKTLTPADLSPRLIATYDVFEFWWNIEGLQKAMD